LPDVTLEPAGRDKRTTLANLFQLYVHDFSEQWFDSARGELGEDGLFAPPYPLDIYWDEAGSEPMLIRVGGLLAGFCLINTESHSGLPIDYSVAEFFVARKHRRGGVGRAAALAALAARPGLWEIAVTRRNVGAQPFWRTVAQIAADGREVTESDLNDERWNGLILRFRNG
jgi:predicted acetyltransferase